MVITDRHLQKKAAAADQWLIESSSRGSGRFMGRITPQGERLFYFRYTTSDGRRDTFPIGTYDPAGRIGLRLADARAKASALSRLYQSGVLDIREHLNTAAAARDVAIEHEAASAATAREQLERESARKLTIKQLFDRWATTELAPHLRADGTRIGRKDGGEYTRQQFARRVFPVIGDIGIAELRKADVLAILDRVRAEGKLRTCNMLLADLKQMVRFAVARDLITHSAIESVSKRRAGGPDTERQRVLSSAELGQLAELLPSAGLNNRSELSIWVMLATGCRIGELVNARWEDVNLISGAWTLPETKNQRAHLIHLSSFATLQFRRLLGLSTSATWVFPADRSDMPVNPKSLGKQFADRQRTDDRRLKNRSKATTALRLAGGRWTAHDLRRTAATLMANLGVSSDVIDECLNHKIRSRVTRVYIRDRRLKEQAHAFDLLGASLAKIARAALTDENRSSTER